MNTIFNPDKSKWALLSKRPKEFDDSLTEEVLKIIDEVKSGGDKAIDRISLRLDKTNFSIVSEEELNSASVTENLKVAIMEAASNIRKFHSAQMPKEISVETSSGVRCMQRSIPIKSIGIYIPGGNAPLFSTILMLAIPASIAGCREIYMCTPADKNGKVSPVVLWTAKYCGVKTIFKIGGVQAIAAMAYGTESIPKVDKIFGPGNKYVMEAKQILGNSITSIDLPAGPSEVMVLADESSVPAFVAADLLSQAEHGDDSQIMLISSSMELSMSIISEIERQKIFLTRTSYIGSVLSNSKCLIFSNRNDMVDFANFYAPEHLIVSLRDPWVIADKIINAGSVFIGNYSPESAGDYASGTNHTLPTSGWAKSYGGVSVESFLRKISFQEITSNGLNNIKNTIIAMADAEGLDAHSNAVKIRLKSNTIEQKFSGIH